MNAEPNCSEKQSNSSITSNSQDSIGRLVGLGKKSSFQGSTAESAEDKINGVLGKGKDQPSVMGVTETSENSPVKQGRPERPGTKNEFNGESEARNQKARDLAECCAGNFIRATAIGQEVRYSFQCKIGHRFQ